MTAPALPLVVESHGAETPLPFPVRRIVCGGHSSRDATGVGRHVQELERLGIPGPREVPTFCYVASYLATVGPSIEVQGPFTSGEAEPVLLFGPGGPWITVGSDQTDRFVERHSMRAAKQLCPKVVATRVWPLSEVEDHWDELVVRSWVRSGRKRRLYQEAPLSALLAPAALLGAVRRHAGRDLTGVAFFAGTVPTVDGEVIYGDAYDLELADPRLDRQIRTRYAVVVLEGSAR